MTGGYALLIMLGFSINVVIVLFGLFVAGSMFFVKLRHEANQRVKDDVSQLEDLHH